MAEARLALFPLPTGQGILSVFTKNSFLERK